MLRLRYRLPIEFEDQFGMTHLKQVSIEMLMTGHARVGPHIEIFQIAHAGGGTVSMRKVRPRVRAQPGFAGAMTAFAGNTRSVVNSRRSLCREEIVKRGMTGRASAIGRRRAERESFGHDLGATCGERRIGAGVKILPRPDDKLVAIARRPSVTTAGTARLRPKEFWN